MKIVRRDKEQYMRDHKNVNIQRTSGSNKQQRLPPSVLCRAGNIIYHFENCFPGISDFNMKEYGKLQHTNCNGIVSLAQDLRT